MQTNELTDDKLRELATLRPDGARVLSIFLNLDPSEFSAPPARATMIQSVLDDAARQLREADGFTRDEQQALKEDIERARAYLKDGDYTKGAHGLALFASGPAGLFAAYRLPRPIETRVVIDDSPFVEPLVELAQNGNWALLLVNRQTGRMFRGGPERLDELPMVVDEVHGQHQQGGWSQARYQRSVDEGVKDHFRHVADVAFRRFKRRPFDSLLLGGPNEQVSEFEHHLHDYLKQRIVGRVDVDVENPSPDEVLDVVRPKFEEIDREREREALDRLNEGVATGGRGTAGLDDTLAALNERRVETLLVNEGFVASGGFCPSCEWVGAGEVTECPVDGTALDRRDSVIESAVELALMQSAEVRRVRHHADELEAQGSVGAVLRF